MAIKQGNTKYIMRLLEQPTETGFTLREPGLVRSFMYGSHERAAIVDFKGEEFDMAAKDVEHVARLMEREDHCVGLDKSKFDSRQSLITIGTILEMAAAKSINNHGAKDVDGQVSNYLTKALTLSEHGIDDGTTPYIWRQPDLKETGQIDVCERPALQILLNALNMAAKVEGIPTDNQRTRLNARLITIVGRIDQITELGRQLYEERQQKRAKKSDL